MAIFVPDPTEKWAVCAASPSRQTLPCDQLRHLTMGKFRQE